CQTGRECLFTERAVVALEEFRVSSPAATDGGGRRPGLGNEGAPGGRSGHGRWQKPGLPRPGDPVCGNQQAEGGRIDPYDQSAGTTRGKRPAGARENSACEVPLRDAQGTAELSLHAPAAQ